MRLRKFEMESAVDVAARPERVWEVFADVRRWPEWSKVCVEVWDAPRSLATGVSFGFRLRMVGVRVPFYVTVIEADPPRRVAWTSTRYAITARRTHEFTPSEAGTTVRDHKAFSSALLPVGLWYPRRVIRTMTEAWLQELKAEAERVS